MESNKTSWRTQYILYTFQTSIMGYEVKEI